MKIRKKFLENIIKEEIRSVLYGEPMKQDVIHIFIKAIRLQDPEYLKFGLNKIGVIPEKAIYMISVEEVDYDFYIHCQEIHNAMVKLLGKGEEMHVSIHDPLVKSDPERDPDPNFMRVPKTSTARNPLDVRKDTKNLIQP